MEGFGGEEKGQELVGAGDRKGGGGLDVERFREVLRMVLGTAEAGTKNWCRVIGARWKSSGPESAVDSERIIGLGELVLVGHKIIHCFLRSLEPKHGSADTPSCLYILATWNFPRS
ncbi:hypothetical protein ACMFMF_001034 [Clarireedia jacksonii]